MLLTIFKKKIFKVFKRLFECKMTNSCIKLVNESLIAASHQKCVSKELAVKDRKTSQLIFCLPPFSWR